MGRFWIILFFKVFYNKYYSKKGVYIRFMKGNRKLIFFLKPSMQYFLQTLFLNFLNNFLRNVIIFHFLTSGTWGSVRLTKCLKITQIGSDRVVTWSGGVCDPTGISYGSLSCLMPELERKKEKKKKVKFKFRPKLSTVEGSWFYPTCCACLQFLPFSPSGGWVAR